MDYLRASLLALASMAIVPCFAQTTTTNVPLPGSELQIKSGYHELNSTDRSISVSVSSALPIANTRATVDYAVSTPAQQNVLGKIEHGSYTVEDNQLMHVKLETQQANVDYGVRYYSSGAQFANAQTGNAIINTLSVRPASTGAEMWTSFKMADVQIKPSVRREEDANSSLDLIAVSAKRLVLPKTTFTYQFASSAVQNLDSRTETKQVQLGLHHPVWQLTWREQKADTTKPATREYSRRRQASGSARLMPESSTTPALNLSLLYDQFANVLDIGNTLQAALNVTKHFDLMGSRTSVAAALRYQKNDRLSQPDLGDDIGVTLTFHHAI